MLKPSNFLNFLKKLKMNFITGVPDSLLKEFSYELEKDKKIKHIIATNEGSAVSLAIGNYLATGKLGVVYMQNSGLNNALNPLISISDPKVYGIPMILMIGWRGEIIRKKQIYDEPQHKKQGEITLQILKLLGIKYKLISEKTKKIEKILKDLNYQSIKSSSPVALVFRKNTFKKSLKNREKIISNLMTREYAIEKIISYTNEKKNFFISTTGMTSRELYELRIKKNQKNHNDFLTVGAMGHANQIAAGIAFNKKNKRIICLDGDGSVLMHMGSLAISSNFENLKHIILNNCAHDSVGGQPTISGKINFINLGKELGYKNTTLINSPKDFTTKKFANKIKKKGSSLIVIMCKKGYRKNLGRPTNIKILKNNFMKELKK